MKHDVRVSALVDELASIEARLDPDKHGQDRRLADLITVVMLVPLAIGLEWHAEHPLLMLGLMVAGLVVNRVPQWFTRWRLKRAQERLFEEYNRILELSRAVGGEDPALAADPSSKPSSPSSE